MMSRLSIGISSKNTTLWCPSLTTQSPRRSPNRRLHDPCGRLTKTWRIRHNTHDNCPRASYQGTQLPLYCLCTLRRYYNRLNLPATNRYKIPHCLLLRQSHGPSCWRYFNPNTLRLHRGPNSNNCPRPYLICTFLPS